MSKSNWLENAVLNSVYGSAVLPAFGTIWVGLHTADPTEDGSAGEVSGGAYARVLIRNDTTNWPAAASGSKSNGTAIAFPEASAPWGTVGWFSTWNAPSGGTMLHRGTIAPTRYIATGVVASFAIGAMTISED